MSAVTRKVRTVLPGGLGLPPDMTARTLIRGGLWSALLFAAGGTVFGSSGTLAAAEAPAAVVAPTAAHAAATDAQLLQTAPADEFDATIRAVVAERGRDERGRTSNTPIPDVTITVYDADGEVVATAVTDDQGTAAIPVVGRQYYRVVVDESTLPDDTALAGSAEQEIQAESWRTDTARAPFFTGESQRVVQRGFDRWVQRFTDGLRFGVLISMCALGLSLIFGTTGLTNFAHGEMVTFGAMIAYLLNNWMHIVLAMPIAVAAGGLLGYCMHRFGFDKLRKRGVGLISQMVITIGMSIFAKNLFLARFGGTAKPYRQYTNQVASRYGPLVITPRDLITALISLAVIVGVAATLQFTRLGKATRAVSDNRELANATGIDTNKIVRTIWIAAGALAAVGGIFRGMDESVSWNMGGGLLFLMFSAITLGGLGNAYGALIGGVVVGLMVEMSTLFGVPTELKTVPALLVLVLILLVRPQGILGRAQRVG